MPSKYKNSIIIYVILAYGITWAILFPLSLIYNNLDYVVSELWHSLGPIGPAIAGVVAIKYWKGKDGLTELKRRCIKYSGILLLLFALMPFIIFVVTFIIDNFTGIFTINDFIQQNNVTIITSVLLFPLASLTYGIFEEVGWRGFLLPSLQRKYNALLSTLILTLIWWLWHVPAFFYRFDLFFALVFMPLLMLSGSIVFTFLFNQSNGSVLMVMIIHVTYDLVSAHVSGNATMVISIVWIVFDIIIIAVFGIKNMSKKERVIIT